MFGATARLAFALGAAIAIAAGGIAVDLGGRHRADASGVLSYAALGDSFVASYPNPSYANYYGTTLAANLGTPVALTNVGVAGWRSYDLAEGLADNTLVRGVPLASAVAAADAVTWDIGTNDLFIDGRLAYKNQLSYELTGSPVPTVPPGGSTPAASWCPGGDHTHCLPDALATFESNWSQSLNAILALRAGSPTRFRTIDLYYPYVDEDTADGTFAIIKPYVDAANAHICSTTTAAGVSVARVSAVFNGASGTEDPHDKGLIQPTSVDPSSLHPNDAGQRAIATAIARLGYEMAPPDSDGDCTVDAIDNCPAVYNPTQAVQRTNFTNLHVYGKPYDDLTNPNATTLGDACNPDIDGDGLLNTDEAQLGPGGASHALCPSASANTDPAKLDTDGDGFTDRGECLLGTDPANAASKPSAVPAADRDHDGLPDAVELAIGTDPDNPDTDGDGVLDGVEVLRYGTNPLLANTAGGRCNDGKAMASINADYTVSAIDLQQVARAFGPSTGANYIPDFDMNRDKSINSTDLLFVAKRFGPC